MNEIMSALFTRLDGQLAIPVYDHVPQDTQDYPFVRINPIQTANSDYVSSNGFNANVQIIGYSRHKGLSEINNVIDTVYAALHQWEMADTATYSIGNFIENSREVVNSPDGETRHSIQQYTFYFDPT